MLTATFCHLRGLSRRSEEKLWKSGILAWQHLRAAGNSPFSPAKTERVVAQLEESDRALAAGDAGHFLDSLPAAYLPRVYPHFRDRIAYVDIETTGLECWSTVTTVALYDGRIVRTFVRDRNLDEFPRALEGCGLIVTYNGARFDLPFLRREFGIPLVIPHLDLMRPLRAVGLRGGLKACERQVGLRRQVPEDMDGFEAVRLWHEHERGKADALAKLLVYNSQDVLSLELLLIRVYNDSMRGYPLFHHIPMPKQPKIEWPG
jgi:uncharacterized protein YprB with RNaseH-like and TPR domain